MKNAVQRRQPAWLQARRSPFCFSPPSPPSPALPSTRSSWAPALFGSWWWGTRARRLWTCHWKNCPPRTRVLLWTTWVSDSEAGRRPRFWWVGPRLKAAASETILLSSSATFAVKSFSLALVKRQRRRNLLGFQQEMSSLWRRKIPSGLLSRHDLLSPPPSSTPHRRKLRSRRILWFAKLFHRRAEPWWRLDRLTSFRTSMHPVRLLRGGKHLSGDIFLLKGMNSSC